MKLKKTALAFEEGAVLTALFAGLFVAAISIYNMKSIADLLPIFAGGLVMLYALYRVIRIDQAQV